MIQTNQVMGMNTFLCNLRILPAFRMICAFILTPSLSYTQHYHPTSTSSVITIGNWDNFDLGYDQGTGNMAAHPVFPASFFTAYNPNSGYHTEDGFGWTSEIPNFGSTMLGDPVVAYDSLGNLFYGNMFGTTIVLGLKVLKSPDNGITWGPGITALLGTDKCWIACDQTNGPNSNNVYTCMTSNTIGVFSRSIDHGASYTTTFYPTTQNLPGMMVCVGPDNTVQGGSVYVVTTSGTPFNSIYTFYRSHDGGKTFSQMSANQFSNFVGTNVNGQNSVSGMKTHAYPMIAADNSYGNHRGRLYLVYASNDPPGDGNHPDIFIRYSDDAGTTWSSALKVNDDPNTQNNSQWHPAIWCDKNTGRLYVTWLDTRDTPTHDSAYVYATYSSNGGQSFLTNKKISNQKMKINCTTCGSTGTPANEGDYNGISSNRKVAMAGWTDLRFGNFMSATAYFPDFAMAVDHSIDTLFTNSDSTIYTVSFPEVKLYTDTVLLSASISPTPTTGTLNISFPSGNMVTTFPGSLPVKIRLTGAVPEGDYQLQFIAQGPNGTPIHQRFATIRVLSGNAVYVIATATPDSICAGASSQLLAKTIKGTSPFIFLWTPSTGLDNPQIANPVATPFVTTQYHVQVTDAVSHTASDSVTISILPVAADPGPITGPPIVCKDSSEIYSIVQIQGATSYSWTVPDGAQIISGQNTPTIIIQWGSTGGIVSVIAGNNCGPSNPGVLEVTVLGIPPQPLLFLGPDHACDAETVSFYIHPVQDAMTYFWTVPSDAAILSGQNTDSISVRWGSAAGNISVRAMNNCGESPTLTGFIDIETMPDAAGNITGNDTVCSNFEHYTYTVPIINQADFYSWTVPTGITMISGSETNSILVSVSPGSLSEIVSVRGVNDCGPGNSSSKKITVKNCVGIDEMAPAADIVIYPNPAEHLLHLGIPRLSEATQIVIVNTMGQKVYEEFVDQNFNAITKDLEVSTFSRGVYFVEIINSRQVQIKKIILQ
jgi:hypothetical protein